MTKTSLSPEKSQRRDHRRTLIGTGVGNALEWYDWNVYAAFTVFIAAQIFNNDNPTSAVLATLAIFAVGFVARPFGGFLFGWIADRRGRKFSLMLAIALASLGSLMIGLTPTFETAGVFSSLMLLVARLMQGLAHGGELPSAQTYLSEAAPRERRGLWSSWMYITGTFGILFGLLVGAVLNSTMSAQAMDDFGWRIPFLLGAVFGLFSLYMRSGMKESEVFEKNLAEKRAHDPVWPQIYRHRKAAMQVIGMTLGITVAYYAWAINAPAFAASSLGIDRGQTLWAGIICNLVFMAALPLWGMLSDKIGRRPVLLVGTLGSAIAYFPMVFLLQDSMWQLIASMSVMLIALSAFLAIAPAVYAELFPTSVRAVGVGLPYALCVALFGGTAPYLQVWMGSQFGHTAFAIYAVALLLISTVFVWFLPETKAKNLA
ncbi:MFS transporter [Mycetocola spongiae]|uniref:MFS transporter n=1 Tax=Mycetocola spongiae TaxID=2859226 RepID=UPI001CF502D3|nr:MFS transporter [Mycetocola spongiae]UCR88892.1 MFS transporter [Mycetocola spongiae]